MECYLCPLADVLALAGQRALVVRLEEAEIGVLLFKDTLYAYHNRCPHQGGPVCLGDVVGKTEVRLGEHQRALGESVSAADVRLVCPWHGLEYDVQTGISPVDPRFRLRPVDAFVRGDDVYVRLDAAPRPGQS